MEKLVSIPVPESRVMDVYKLLSGNGGPGAESVSADPSESLYGWDAATIRKHVGRASETIKGLVKHLADHAGQEVTTQQAAEALGLQYGWNSLAGALGAFGRYCSNRDLEFPWETWYDAEGWTRMMMSPSVADQVRKAGL